MSLQALVTVLYYGGWTCVWIGVVGVVDLVGLFLWGLFSLGG